MTSRSKAMTFDQAIVELGRAQKRARDADAALNAAAHWCDAAHEDLRKASEALDAIITKAVEEASSVN